MISRSWRAYQLVPSVAVNLRRSSASAKSLFSPCQSALAKDDAAVGLLLEAPPSVKESRVFQAAAPSGRSIGYGTVSE
jgi:hypothetical protein